MNNDRLVKIRVLLVILSINKDQNICVAEKLFIPVHSVCHKLQNHIFSKFQKESLLGTCLDTLFSGHNFLNFGPSIWPLLPKKLGFYSKLISYSESASKTESIYIYSKDFWNLDFFVKKVTPTPPQGWLRGGQKIMYVNNAICLMESRALSSIMLLEGKR